jgi:multimeric flavodoxin WrbA
MLEGEMTTILGMVGSARKWGNSEIVVRQILRGAAAEGAEVRLLRLTDLHLESCSGCMRCIIGGQACPWLDDMPWLIDTIQQASGLVLAAPTYWLGPAAVIKLVLDRLLMVTGRVEQPLPTLRPAVTVVTAGLEGWRGITLPFLNALTSAFGFVPIQSMVAIGPGPGEVLLDDELMQTCLAAGQRLGRGEIQRSDVQASVCPVCGCDAFLLSGTQAICPICARQATVEMGEGGVHLRFDPVVEGLQRWAPEGLHHHMIDWVQATGPRYMALRAEIKVRRAPFRQMDVEWLRPPRLGGGKEAKGE